MNHKLQKQIIKDLTTQLVWKLDQIFTEGLRIKGHHFENPKDLEDFIRKNCRCEDNPSKSEKVYYVNDIPFLIHYYKTNLGINSIFDGFKSSIEVDHGTFAYL